MLINPYTEKQRIVTYAGTRLIQETFDLVGAQIQDLKNPQRVWTLQSFYAPCRRGLGGLRAKFLDQKKFTTFLNQRDLEVLIGLVEPGSYCEWLGKNYVEPGGPDWYGFMMDEDDLLDDLHTREMFLRAQSMTGILMAGDITRRLHLEDGFDVEELQILLWDTDPETGLTPDIRLSTIERRWSRVERTRLRWERTH